MGWVYASVRVWALAWVLVLHRPVALDIIALMQCK
jgi:hypothetical protein